MMDQRDKFQARGVAAEYVCEKQKDTHILEKVSSGEVQLVFIGPESIVGSRRYHKMLASPCYQQKLVAIAVDEAHCIKTWLVDYCMLAILTQY